MKTFANASGLLLTLAAGALVGGCEPDAPPPVDYALSRAFRSETFEGCVLASPLVYEGASGPEILVASGDGRIVALDPESGESRWSLALPHPDDQMAHIIATPALAGDRLYVAWQEVMAGARDPAAAPRQAHHVAAIDLARRELDAARPVLTLSATVESRDGSDAVPFSPANALSRSRLAYVAPPSRPAGLLYVSFGNARDIQPWHGWVFEIDLGAWAAGGAEAAQSAVLLTTPTSDCGPAGVSGSADMICGGGVWAPAGPLLLPSSGPEGFELLIPTGNGALDLGRELYAHTLMRVRGPGLAFDPGCDPALCAGFDALDVSRPCIESCADLFIPRLREGDPPFDAPGCEGLSFFECYAALDWDLGANSAAPVELGGRALLVLPQKDGGVSLIDRAQLGRMWDRLQVVAACGAGGASCEANWAGMMVTQPVITEDEAGAPLAVVATFMPDDAHWAGLVGLRIVEGAEGPRLEEAWSYPPRGGEEPAARFRRHPGAPRLLSLDGRPYVAIVEQGRADVEPGVLHLVRATDGALAHRVDLDGPGQRYAEPALLDRRLYVPSCRNGNAGPGWIEAWDIRPAP